MTHARRALVLGHDADAMYHPLAGVDAELRGILEPRFGVTCGEATTALADGRLHGVDCLVLYTDRWRQPIPSAEVAGLIAWTAMGGGVLAIHNGISLQANPECAQLFGARFTGHPAQEPLPFRLSDPEHPLIRASARPLVDFEMQEEPYRFEPDPLAAIQVFLTYAHQGVTHPAGWSRSFGLGRVAYLAPGHSVASFQVPGYRDIISAAADWVAGGR